MEYLVSKKALVALDIFDIIGRMVLTVIWETSLPALYVQEWNMNKFSNGNSLLNLTVGSNSQTNNMLLAEI